MFSYTPAHGIWVGKLFPHPVSPAPLSSVSMCVCVQAHAHAHFMTYKTPCILIVGTSSPSSSNLSSCLHSIQKTVKRKHLTDKLLKYIPLPQTVMFCTQMITMMSVYLDVRYLCVQCKQCTQSLYNVGLPGNRWS